VRIRAWDIVYYASIVGGAAASIYYAVLWWAAGAEWWRIVLMLTGLIVCGYMMGRMVDNLWFGTDGDQ
jgi:hypothetical protein